MDLFQGLKVAAAVQRAGSFSGAARQIGVTPASVAKLIAQLETRLGTRLFDRTTHHLAVSDEGRDLLQRLEAPLREVEDALAVGRTAAASRGAVKVSVPASFARMAVLPALADFQAKFPDIQLGCIRVFNAFVPDRGTDKPMIARMLPNRHAGTWPKTASRPKL